MNKTQTPSCTSPEIISHAQTKTQNSNSQKGYLQNNNQDTTHVSIFSKVFNFILCKKKPNSATLQVDHLNDHGPATDISSKKDSFVMCVYLPFYYLLLLKINDPAQIKLNIIFDDCDLSCYCMWHDASKGVIILRG